MKKVERTENVYVETGIDRRTGVEYSIYYIKVNDTYIEVKLIDLIEQGLM